MFKLVYRSSTLATFFIYFTTQIAFSFPINYPVVPNSDSNTPFCYMKTAEGRILDLRNICGFVSPTACSETNIKPEIAVFIKDFCKRNQRCQITSTCNAFPQTVERSTTDEPR